MAEGSISGKDAAGATFLTDTRTSGAGKHRQTLSIGNDGDLVAAVEAWGQLHVTQGPATLFFDDFSAALDPDLWASTGTAPAVTGGRLVPSAAASTYNFLRSVDLMPNGTGWKEVRAGVQLEGVAAVGAGRFWGLGTAAVTPAAAVLVQDGVGFEVDQVSGGLLAVTYAAGVRTTVTTLVRPGDGLLHAYTVAHRVTRAYWMIDGNAVVAATVGFPDVPVADLPVAVVRQNAATFTGTPVFSVTGIFAGDTSRDATQLADAKVPARRLRISAAGAASVRQVESTLAVTVTAASGVAATLTLPAAGPGLFHFVTSLRLVLYATAARVGAAAPVVVTTTNLPGALAFTMPTAQAIGTNALEELAIAGSLRSSAANTATTVVAPIAAGGIWRLTATYFTAAAA